VKRLFPALLLVSLFTGCTHSVHQIATGGLEDIPRGASTRVVSAEAEQHVILFITGNTDYADEAYRELLAQCPDGAIHAIEARHSTKHGFLSFTNYLKAQAICVKKGG
jgi:hypothetical protein